MAVATATKKTKAPKVVKTAPKEVVKEAPKAFKKPVKSSSTAFAVIATGGKQYRVAEGDRVKIEKLQGDHREGDVLLFKEVLLKGDGADVKIGTPHVSGSIVSSTITKISRYKTVDVIKYKQKSRYFKKYGHRQPYFEVTIDSIK